MDANSWLRLTMVIVAGILYFGVFLTLSVFVSTLTQHSSSSFLLLLVVWIFAVLIIPRASVLISGRAVDVPSVDQVDYEKSKYSRQLFTERMEGMQKFIQENRSNDDHGQFMADMQEFSRGQQEEFDERMSVLAEKLNEDRDNKANAQQVVALALARISPTASFSLAAADLASTSLALRDSYMNAANAYQSEFAQFMQRKDADQGGFMMSRRTMHGTDEVEEPEPINVRELPEFTYEPPEASEAITASLPDLGLLLLFNIVFFTGAFVAFLRYDVR